MVGPALPLLRALLAVLGCAVCLRAAPATAEKWIEVRSPHFVVLSNAGEKQARQTVDQFEQFRGVFQTAFPKARLDPGQPLIIFAVKNEKSLKELLPQFWETKGHTHPAGIFVSGPDKHYVALRLDTSGDNPYHVIYHEYVHLLLNLNFQWLPLWLDEGLAEFYANASISNKAAGLGRPDESHLQLLKQSRLLPLDALLGADHSSPYYNETNKANVFYAQSWALTHYLLLDNKTGHVKELLEFMDRAEKGTPPAEAFTRVLGDPKKFQKVFDAYTHQERFYYVNVKIPVNLEEKSFTARELPSVEATAARGDFHVHMHNPAGAKTLLEEAMTVDRNLAAPRESMGLLCYYQGQLDEALRWFSEAVQLDSRNFAAYYFHARLSSHGLLTGERLAVAEKDLQKAVELNHNFAPAYSALAQLNAARGERLEEALAQARKATELEPGNLSNHLAMAAVLMRMERFTEAEALSRRVLAAARRTEERFEAEQFLQGIRSFQDHLASRKQMEEEVQRVRTERQKEAAEAAASSKETSRLPVETNVPAARPHSMTAPGEGRVVAISCDGKALDLTLEYHGFKLNLHAGNLWEVEYTTFGEVPKDFNPCTYLKGSNVKAQYRVTPGRPYAGELVSVEIKK